MASEKIASERRAEIGQDRRTRTRAAILRAAFDLLGRQDGRSSRIDDICQAAHVSRATFYNYFTSVEELFKATAFDISHDFNDALRAVILRVPSGAFRIAFALRYTLHKSRRDPAWGWAMVNLSAGGPILGEESYLYATQSIDEGILTEQFRIPSTQIGLDLVMGATLAGMITLLQSEQPEDYPELIVAHIFRGLGVSETLVKKCISAVLPDPFEFLATHGRGSDVDPRDASQLVALSIAS